MHDPYGQKIFTVKVAEVLQVDGRTWNGDFTSDTRSVGGIVYSRIIFTSLSPK